jgi:phosphohistidine phosphatase
MKAYLVQHGKQVSKEENPERPLSDRGRADVGKVAAALTRIGIGIQEIVHSGKTRAEQTAEIMAAELKPATPPRRMEGLSPLDDVHPIAEDLKERDKDIMLVGHLPHLGKLVALLTAGTDSTPVVTFQQGGVVCLQRDEKGVWTVAWMLVPAIISP